MELVIKLLEDSYKATCNGSMLPSDVENVVNAIRNGIPLPKGHGDLVERDRVIDLLNEQEYSYYTELDKVCDTVYEAPTIIEADGGAE